MNSKRQNSTFSAMRKAARKVLEPLESRVLLSVNPIVAENQLAGTPSSVWNVTGAGDPTIQGYSTDISVNQGQSISFKINDTASAPYHIDIYRMGYYQGLGARLVATITSAQTIVKVQPNPIFNASTALVDAGNWSATASWAVPANSTSGVYFARVARNDTGGAFMIPFVVRSDSGHSAVLFQTSDSTWQAYNTWGGYSLYQATGSTQGPGYGGAAYAVSYNRPFINAGTAGGLGVTNWFFYDEFPMVRWLEQNGYDVSYFTDMDSDRLGSLIRQHQLFLSVGHDEYWSNNQMANVTAARDAGVNLAFLSGNEAFWKTYFTPSVDGSNTPNRTLVDYKETHANAIIDPNNPNVWTGTWQDPRFSPPADGGRPQNQLTGQLFTVNRGPNDVGTPFTVPFSDSKLRIWRNTSVASLQSGQTATLGDFELGYEWDEDVDNGFRPAGLIDMSSTTQSVTQKFIDYGNTTAAATATNSLTLYRASSGALVFGAGMVQYDWGLDGFHDDSNGNLGINSAPVLAIQQATVNVFADMNVQPSSLASGLVAATASIDTIAPASSISSPLNGVNLLTGNSVTISGTAADTGGGVVGGVEVSVDGGQTWHPAKGTTSWTYTWVPDTAGQIKILSRATDDSGNIEQSKPGITVSVSYQPTSRTGLVAEYSFDDASGTTLTDTSGNHNNGTISGATWTSGLFSGALSFNGINSWVTVNNSASLNLTTAMTLEAWIKPTSLADWSAVLLKERTAGLDYALYADNGAGQPPSGYVHVGGTDDAVVGPSAAAVGGWTNLAVTYDGSDLLLYVNGTLVSTETYGGNIITSSNPLRIGGDSIWGEYFNGLIDQVRIYNRPLNQGEIRSDMSTPVGGSLETTAPTVTLTAPPNGATISGISTLSASASDNVFVSGVQFLMDGQAIANVTAAPYAYAWDTRTIANGTHTLAARAQDMAGNSTTTPLETITVNNPPNTTPPTVQLVYPPTGTGTSGKLVLDAIASDPFGVSSVQYQINGSNLGSPVTSAPYRLLFDSTSLADGTYSITAVATDTSGNTSTSNAVSITVDHTPPSILSTTPAAGAAGVSTASGLSATFSESVQVGTISVTLRDPSGNVVATDLTYDGNTDTVTIAHGSVALEPLTTYTVTVSAADLAGNAMSPHSWSFSTGNAIIGATIWDASTVPSVPSVTNDTGAIEIGVKFRSDVAGTITGIRFYKGGTANSGTHLAHLWTLSGTLLATGTFANETSFGWQQVNFSSPVPIAANTTYVASYYAPHGAYAFDASYFASSETNSGPLHALQDGMDSGNGVFIYSAGNTFPNGSFESANYWVDVVFNSSTVDTTPPTVTGEFPSPNATGVAQTAAVTVTFSKSVQPATISFVLKDTGGSVVQSTVAYNSATNTATLTPSAALAATASYTATVNGATDLVGNIMSAPFGWSFTTASAAAPPTVVAESPAPGATNVAKGSSITATFSKAVNDGTISFVLRDAAGNTVSSAVSYDDEASTATLTPSAALAAGTAYTATVSGATDLSGNAMTTPFSWSFTTANPSNTFTIWNASTTPANASWNDTNAIEVGMKFRSDTAGYITGIRFYKGSLNTGTHLAHLWTSGGTLVATATFSGETATGWQQVNFGSPVAITANTTYVASYYAPVGGYATNPGFFTSAGADNAPLHALATGVDGGNGVYRYVSGGGFPNSTFNNANYWVDVVYSPTASDTTPPTLTAQSPASAATAVPISTTVSATFSEAVQPSTISMVLKDSSGNVVPATVAYSSATQVATLTPSTFLSTGSNYTVTVSSTADLAGNVMTPVSWSFATTASVSIFGNSTPANPSWNDTNAIEVGVKFRSDAAGSITGIRFYKGNLNTGTHIAHLWTSSGTLLATATFTNETATGWQQISFASPVAIAPNTTYVASYYAPAGGYATNPGYFTSAGADNAPLHALATGVDGGNGVYRYISGGGFPNNTYNNANYWVDVVYTSPAADTTPPAITTQTPASGASGVAISSTVVAAFSKPVQSSTISMVLKDSNGNVVSSTVTYSSATQSATLTPGAVLSTGSSYTVTASGATDLSGNVMSPVSWSFSTAATASIWSSSATPANAAWNDSNAIEVGVKFTSDVSGNVTGVRFYKGSGNVGTHIGNLWSNSGQLLASVTFSGETASGWQQATFANPVTIVANATYVVSYYAPSGHYATDPGYFSSSGVDNAPLHALSTTAGGGDGVFIYNSHSTFPNQTYNAANYWVDVLFTKPLPGVAPRVTAESPSPSATGVSPAAAPTATFDQPVQSASISFTLTGPSGSVAGSIGYNAATNTATFTPSAPLASGTAYTATVSAQSSSGVAMASPFSWSFTTAGAWQQTTAADFNAGTLTNTIVTNNAGGEVQLATTLLDNFAGTSLSSNWVVSSWASQGGGPTSVVVNNSLSNAGAEILSTKAFANAAVDGQVAFAAAAYQHFGMATDLSSPTGNSFAIFSTMGTTNTLFAWVDSNGTTQNVSLGTLPAGTHDYKIVPVAAGYQFFVDGVLKTEIDLAIPAATALKAAISSFGSTAITATSIQLWATSGTFVSSVFNAGHAVNWNVASWTASAPAGTTYTIQVRSSNDGSTWSSWQTLTISGGAISPTINAQYLQYQVIMTTTAPTQTPVLSDITLNWR